MNRFVRPESRRLASAFCAVGLALAPALAADSARAGSAFAQDLDIRFGRPARPAPANPCAAYGAGFQPLAGSSSCVKIDGRVRVEAGYGVSDWRVAPAAGAATRATAPNFGPAPGHGGAPSGQPSHLRLQRRY